MHPFLANIVVDYFLRGGPIMWPILFCMVAALIVSRQPRNTIGWLLMVPAVKSSTGNS